MGGSERDELEKRDNKFENHSGKKSEKYWVEAEISQTDASRNEERQW